MPSCQFDDDGRYNDKPVSSDATSLIASLLTWDASARLGAAGVQQMSLGEKHEVLLHPFLVGIDWEALEAKKEPPPFEFISNDQAIGQTMPVVEPELLEMGVDGERGAQRQLT